MPSPSRFEAFLEDVLTLHEMIVTFLAVLELIHMQVLTFRIEKPQPDQSSETESDCQKETGLLKEEELIWLYRI